MQTQPYPMAAGPMPVQRYVKPPVEHTLTVALCLLQLKLFWRYTKSSTSMMVGSIVMTLMVVGSIIPAAIGLGFLRITDVMTRGIVLTVIFAFLTLMWPIAVTLMTGSNDMLDPGRFALYPVKPARLLPGLLAASALGLGGLMMLVLGLGYLAAWSTSVPALLAAVFGWVVGTATCLVSSRAVSSLLADLLRRRKARDLAMVGIVLVILLISIGSQVLGAKLGSSGGISVDLSPARFEPLGKVIAWTPFGWAWGVPWAVASGNWGQAGAWFVLAIAWLTALAWVWAHQFAKSLISPLEAGGVAVKVKGTNPLDRFIPDTPAGAVAKRGLRYWRRDPRRALGAIMSLLMPFLMAISVLFGNGATATREDATIGMTILAYAPVMMGWMAGMFVAYDISYDGSALAAQIVAGVSGRDDRWGRAMTFLMLFVPLQLVYLIGFTAMSGRWNLLPGVAGLCFAVLLASGGIGSWSGAMWQVPQPPAGSSLMGRNNSGGVAGFLSSMVVLFLPMVVCIPTIALAVLDPILGPLYGWLALVVGLATGVAAMWWGIVQGGKHLDANWPEVLAKVTWKG